MENDIAILKVRFPPNDDYIKLTCLNAPGAILKVRQTIQMMITSNAFVCTRSTVQAVKFARSVLSGQLVFPGQK